MDGTVGIQVVARLRPLDRKEKADGTLPVVTASTADKTVTIVRGTGNRSARAGFKVDNVFGSFATQQEIFDQTMPPIIKDVMRGYQSTVFAYGQTGTGKTYTMEGAVDDEAHMGIIPRAAMTIFEKLKGETYIESTVSVSYLEIYNEELNDLLMDPAKPAKVERTGSNGKKVAERGLKIMEGNAKQGGVHCSGLSRQVVTDVAGVAAILHAAQERRNIGETKMNKASSRSHCLFTMTVESKEQTEGGFVMTRVGKLNLVDLAGSECAKSAGTENVKQERERKNINTSLLSLGRVIMALKAKSNVIPYRDSKLTRLLQVRERAPLLPVRYRRRIYARRVLPGACRRVWAAAARPALSLQSRLASSAWMRACRR
jgi:hypothetical protein